MFINCHKYLKLKIQIKIQIGLGGQGKNCDIIVSISTTFCYFSFRKFIFIVNRFHLCDILYNMFAINIKLTGMVFSIIYFIIYTNKLRAHCSIYRIQSAYGVLPPIEHMLMKELHTAIPQPACLGSSSLTDPHHRARCSPHILLSGFFVSWLLTQWGLEPQILRWKTSTHKDYAMTICNKWTGLVSSD